MKTRFRNGIIVLAIVVWAMGSTANADPVAFSHPDGTTHYYDLVFAPDYITWDGAEAAAEAQSFNSLQGHLATITSQAENQVLLTFGTTDVVPYWTWLGGFQPQQPSSQTDPSLNWQWVTGETWQYTNWGNGEPNDYDHQDIPGHPTIGEENNGENNLIFMRNAPQFGEWNDYTNSKSYFIEYEGQAVPEPTSAALLLLGCGAVVLNRRKHRLV